MNSLRVLYGSFQGFYDGFLGLASDGYLEV